MLADEFSKLSVPLLGNYVALLIRRGVISSADALVVIDDLVSQLEKQKPRDEWLLAVARHFRKGIETVRRDS